MTKKNTKPDSSLLKKVIWERGKDIHSGTPPHPHNAPPPTHRTADQVFDQVLADVVGS